MRRRSRRSRIRQIKYEGARELLISKKKQDKAGKVCMGGERYD